MAQQFVLKRGATFSVDVAYTPAQGDPADLADFAISSQVRTQTGSLVAELTVLKAPDNLSFQVFAPNGTDAWPYGTLAMDLRFELDESISYTETVLLSVAREVTR